MVRNLTAGNRRQKANFIVVGAIPRLVYIIQQEDCMDELRRDCITLLTSLAKGFLRYLVFANLLQAAMGTSLLYATTERVTPSYPSFSPLKLTASSLLLSDFFELF